MRRSRRLAAPPATSARYDYYAPAVAPGALGDAALDLSRRLGLLELEAPARQARPPTIGLAGGGRQGWTTLAAHPPPWLDSPRKLEHGEPAPPTTGIVWSSHAPPLYTATPDGTGIIWHRPEPKNDPFIRARPMSLEEAMHHMDWCEPEDVLHAKEAYTEAQAREAHATAYAAMPPPPPSPPPSPPSSPTPEMEQLRISLDEMPALHTEGDASPPASPPPSPPAPLEERLARLAAAEDAVARNYAFPEEPTHFEADVRPHIVRLILSVGQYPRNSSVRAVLAVLIRSDDQNTSPSDLFVYSLLEVPRITFGRWKATIDTLRADGATGANLLAFAGGPGPSAPPSPAHSDDDDGMLSARTLMDDMRLANRAAADPSTWPALDASWARCLAFNTAPWHGEAPPCASEFEHVANLGGPFTALDAPTPRHHDADAVAPRPTHPDYSDNIICTAGACA